MSVNRQYNNLFQGKGTKPGTTVDLRRPVYLSGGRGQEITPEGIKDNLVPLTINTQYHQAVAISAQEEALNMESYAQQVVQPAVDVITNMIDVDGLKLVDEVPRFVGVPGTNPAIEPGLHRRGRAARQRGGARERHGSPRHAEPEAVGWHPRDPGDAVQPVSKDVSEQNRTGNMGDGMGLQLRQGPERQHAHRRARSASRSAGNQPLVDGEVTEGATKVHVDRLANKSSGWGRKGDKFQIVACGAVNPSSQEPHG